MVNLYTDKYINIGIDEVGRGPLAGPVAVGVFVVIPQKKHGALKELKKIFRGAKESKQLSEQEREKWFSVIEQARDEKFIDFHVSFQSEKIIDKKGLTFAINTAMKNSLEKIVRKIPQIIYDDYRILLDGGLHAPAHFKNQKTIIRGDEKVREIALASICAKVLRDRRMRTLAKKYPQYDFDIHKGYGTRAHYSAIRTYGLSPIHRRSFLKKILL